MQRDHLFFADHLFYRRLSANGVSLQDLQLLCPGGVLHEDLEQKSIQLRFRQWKSAFHLNGVLRGQDEEGLIQKIGLVSYSYLFFLHGLQERALGLGRRPVDLIGQDDVGKDRPCLKPELLYASGLVNDGSAGDVCRHKVRSALYPAVVKAQAQCSCLYQQRFGKSRIALQKGMASGNNGDQ